MKAVKLLVSTLLLSMSTFTSITLAAPGDAEIPFYQGKTLAHPIISGARDSSAILVFIQEGQTVKGYYCFCDKDDQINDHLPHLFGTFPNATIESVFYADLDQDGQTTLVLSKSNDKFALQGWRYNKENSKYIPLPKLQPVLDPLISDNKNPNATVLKRALGKLPPYDYSAEYPKSGIADFDNIDFTQGKLVGWYLDDGTPSKVEKQPAGNVFFYKKTFAKKDGLFLTATYLHEENSNASGFRVSTISWQAEPTQFRGTEEGPYVYYPSDNDIVTGFYKKGIADGKWVTDGQNDKSSGSYVDGKQQGQWTFSGQQESATGMMKDSKREGQWQISDGIYGNNPALSGFDTYRNDQRNGPSERRQADVLLQKGDYVDGLREGVWITPEGDGSYVKGVANGVWQLKVGNGEIQQVPLNAGKKQGELRWTDKNGRLMRVINYQDDIVNGLFQKYNAAGKMVYQANYQMSKLDGSETEYYDDGTLKAERGYRNGELDGANRYNFPDGKPQVIANFSQGREVGQMQEFTASGVKITERNHCPAPMRGLCGKQQTFNPDGSPLTDSDYLFTHQQTNNSWYPNGQRKDETRIGADDSYNQISYHPNGQISCLVHAQGFTPLVIDGKEYKNYEGALRQGESACYYPNGKVKSSGIWKDGKLTTKCLTRFDENGKQTSPGPEGCPKPQWHFE